MPNECRDEGYVVIRAGCRRADRAPRKPLWIGTLLAVFALGSCGGAVPQADPPLPAAPGTIRVAMREYAFDHKEEVPSGRVVVKARNGGKWPHDLVIIPLGGTAVALSELLKSPVPLAVRPLYALPSRQPDEVAVFAVDLSPGRYGLVCFVEDGDGTQHYELGMFSEFDVGGGQSDAVTPR